MNRLFLVIFMALLSSSTLAQDCDDINLSFMDMRICMSDKADSLTSEMGTKIIELKDLIAKVYLSPKSENGEASATEVIEAFNRSQLAWDEFLKKECEYSYQTARGGTGTGAAHAAVRCIVEQTTFRIETIEQQIVNLKELL